MTNNKINIDYIAKYTYSYNQSNTFNLLIYEQKNFISIHIYFFVIALQSYRKILKKYRKRAISLQKKQTIFQKIEKTVFIYSHIECYANIWKF